MKLQMWITPLTKQIWVVSAALTYLFCAGMVLSYPSSILPALREPDSQMHTDLYTATWIASSVGLVSMIGYFAVGYSMERWGRKKSQVLIMLPAVAGWALIFLANNIPTIIVGRMFNGISGGAAVGLSAVIIAEYTSPENRGMFLNLKSGMCSLGSVAVHILEHYVSWRTIPIIAIVLNTMPLVLQFKFPESPTWLASEKKFEACEESFLWLRGKSEKSLRELDALTKSYMTESSYIQEETTFLKKAIDFLKNFKRRNFYMPVLVILLGVMVMELSGRNFFVSYAVDIVNEIMGDKTQSFYCIIGVDSVATICAVLTPALVKLVRRRLLLFRTAMAALIVLALFCLYLFLVSRGIIPQDYPWIPLTLFVLYYLFVNLGCSPIPYILLGELLPVTNKGLGTALVGVILSSCLQVSLQTTPFLLANVKVYGTFTVTGIVMAVVLLIMYYILPETKDKTLLEIDNFFLFGKYDANVKKVSITSVRTNDFKQLNKVNVT